MLAEGLVSGWRGPRSECVAHGRARASSPTGSRFRFVALSPRLLSIFPVFPPTHTIRHYAPRATRPAGTPGGLRDLSLDPVISISDAQRRPVPRVGWVRSIHHGLPERLLTPQPVRPTYFAFLGRISPEKAVDQAIWIAKRCGLPLKIAAKVDAVDRDYFESEIRKLLTPPDVEYIGEISDSEKSSFLSGAMALLAPIAWPEPFGLVLIEAMACGTPVIAFNRGSVPEIVEDGLTGFVVEGKEEAVAATDRLSRLSRRAIRQRFEERFTARRMAREYLIVYRSLIEKRPHRQLPRRSTQDARKSGAEYRGQLTHARAFE